MLGLPAMGLATSLAIVALPFGAGVNPDPLTINVPPQANAVVASTPTSNTVQSLEKTVGGVLGTVLPVPPEPTPPPRPNPTAPAVPVLPLTTQTPRPANSPAPNPAKTPDPNETVIKVVGKDGETTSFIVSKVPAGQTATPSATVSSTPSPRETVYVDKPVNGRVSVTFGQALASVIGVLLIGFVMALFGIYFAYVLGFKDAERKVSTQYRAAVRDVFRKE